MGRQPNFRIKISPGGLKNTEYRPQKLDPRARRALVEAETMEGMAEAEADKGNVEGGLELLRRAANLRGRS